MARLFDELRRRNVFRVAIAYLVASWLLIQLADILVPLLVLPEWVSRLIFLLLVIGFVPTMIAAWALELTPEGIRLERDVAREESITPQTGRKLDRLIIGVLAAAVVLLVTDKLMLRNSDVATPAAETPVSAVTEKSIAVLPFVAMSDGPDDGYFADGLTEEILNALTQLPELLVTARTSAFHFKDRDIPVPEIAATLGVEHVVEGSVRRDRDRLRITAQLVRAADGFHVWSETYDRTTDDRFAVQMDIAEKIAAAMDIVLDDTSRARMQAIGMRDPEAFVAYQKGLSLLFEAHGAADTMETLRRANSFFDIAIERVPTFPDAYAWHSDYFTHVVIYAARGEEVPGEYADDISGAVDALESDLAAAVRYARNEQQRLNFALDRAVLTGNWRGLSDLVDRALEHSTCRLPLLLATVTTPFGRAEKGLARYRRMIECDPLNIQGYGHGTRALNWLGEHEAAIDMATTGRRISNANLLNSGIVTALLNLGRFDQAEEAIAQFFGDSIDALELRLKLELARGNLEQAREMIEANAEVVQGDFNASLSIAAAFGDREEANRMAAAADSRPFGHMALLSAISACACGAPFDLDATPNFARMIEESGLAWPPQFPGQTP